MIEIEKKLSIEQMLAVVNILKLKKGEYITINGLKVTRTIENEEKKK